MNNLVPVNGHEPNVPAQSAFSFRDIERIAQAFAASRMFGVADANAALTLCLMAQAEGQHPAIAFRDYSIIQGRPAKKAEAMLRDFINSGGKVQWKQLDDERAEAVFSHPAGGTATIDWDMVRAKQAGMANKDNWKKYPRAMLRARVVSEGVRTVCPMATSGMYVPEEVQDFDDPLPATNPVAGNPTTADDPRREPAPREKLEGPHGNKTALRNAINQGVAMVRKCKTIEELDNLVKAGAKDIAQAERYWPALLNGFPDIPEDIGLRGEVEKRRTELLGENSDFSALVRDMKQTETKVQFDTWIEANADAIAALDGEDGRKFEQAKDWHESAILEMDRTDA